MYALVMTTHHHPSSSSRLCPYTRTTSKRAHKDKHLYPPNTNLEPIRGKSTIKHSRATYSQATYCVSIYSPVRYRSTLHQSLFRRTHSRVTTTLNDMAPYLIAGYSCRSKVDKNTPLPSSFKPGPFDVICGRNLPGAYRSVGNRRYRLIITASMQPYVEARSKTDKSLVVTSLVDLIRRHGGGFVKPIRRGHHSSNNGNANSNGTGTTTANINTNKRKDCSSAKTLKGPTQGGSTSQWVDIGDRAARDKVGHSLREAMPAAKEFGYLQLIHYDTGIEDTEGGSNSNTGNSRNFLTAETVMGLSQEDVVCIEEAIEKTRKLQMVVMARPSSDVQFHHTPQSSRSALTRLAAERTKGQRATKTTTIGESKPEPPEFLFRMNVFAGSLLSHSWILAHRICCARMERA